MTKQPEVISMMDGTTPSLTATRPPGFLISKLTAALIFTVFIVCLIFVALIAYSLSSCDSGGTTLASTRITADYKKPEINVRLPRSVIPDSYNIELLPFIWEKNFTFNGQISIIVNVTEVTNNITLHVCDLEILNTNVTLHPDGQNIDVSKVSNDSERQFLIIHFDDYLQPGQQYSVGIRYIGILNDMLQGFYRSFYTVNGTKRWIATTQFQSTDARRAFPCFDEPALKARFTIHIARPENMSAVSNMPSYHTSPVNIEELPGYQWDHFEESVPMSTYLVAFTVSDFAKESVGNFSVLARKDAIAQANYSLEIGPKILKHYEDFFQIKFPLPKIDMIALPDFAAGAMENWGLITYRETTMLYQQGISTNKHKLRVATVVSHELAHQWFGNLVTPSWWSDLWLNEGFASYVECLGVDAVEPLWRKLEQFVTQEMQGVYLLDVYKSSHPISVNVNHPSEIDEIFDSISYDKSAAVIRMMDHFLTTDVFKQGLTNYLKKKAYQSATQDDLWQALTEEAHNQGVLQQDVTVKEIMDTWTLQTGFPLVTVIRNYEDGSAVVSQRRFILGNSTEETRKSVWWIPLTYTTSSTKDFSTTTPKHWLKKEREITLTDLHLSSSEWIIFNIKETGFYRINYDTKNWELLTQQLLDSTKFKEIGVINRAQLIDDALNLARAGVLNYSMAFNLTKYLSSELEYFPWKSAFTAFDYLDSMLCKTSVYDRFKAYLLELMTVLYEDTGFMDSLSDSQLRVYKRVEVLKWACALGHEDCVRNAVTQFQNWRSSPHPDKNNPISPNLKATVYCTALRVGGQAEWDFAWQRYLKSNVGSEKSLLLNAMGCTREPWMLTRYISWAMLPNSGIRKQDATSVFAAVSSNVIGQPIVFNFIRDHWPLINDYFGSSMFTLNTLLRVSTTRMNNKHELRNLKEFAREQRADLESVSKVVEQVIENVETNVDWYHNNYKQIIEWLQSNTKSSGENLNLQLLS
ncbi:aminopeptidase N-like [Lycorma delicatula]|uniref:aminopeptidase N-like n=1 Tax=Lycorma delicatula TaxID=130591 RepID=UPI003F50DA23